MKKLLGIMAVVALLAAPALAQDPPVPVNVGVEITVMTYAEMTQPDPLVMDVTDPEGLALATGNIANGTHQAESAFTVKSNSACTLTVETAAGETTGYKTISLGMAVGPHPTAWLYDLDGITKLDGIGYGLSVSGADSGGNWVPGPFVETGVVGTGILTAGFIAGDTPATVKINSYLDSNRQVGVSFAQPGEYTGTLIFTVSAN